MFYRRFLLLLIPALLVCTLQSGCGGADQEGDLEPQESANDDTHPIGEQPVSEEPDGDELGENPDDKDVDPVTGTPPGIVSTDPEDGATGVLANSTVTIEFSAAITPN